MKRLQWLKPNVFSIVLTVFIGGIGLFVPLKVTSSFCSIPVNLYESNPSHDYWCSHSTNLFTLLFEDKGLSVLHGIYLLGGLVLSYLMASFLFLLFHKAISSRKGKH